MAKKNELNYFDVLITASQFSHQTAVQLLEMMTNYTEVTAKACEDVADIVQGVIMKHN